MGFPFRITGRRFSKFFLLGFLGICIPAGGKNKVGYLPGKLKWGIFSGKSKPDF